MSSLRGKAIDANKIDGILVLAIIVCASIVVTPWIIPRPSPEPSEVVLHILTQDDIQTQIAIEGGFLNSQLAEQYNIVDIKWTSLPSNLWYDRVGEGYFDVVMGTKERVLLISNLLSPLNQSLSEGVNDSIAGVGMKAYHWSSYGFYVAIFELLVNQTLLQEEGVPIPRTVDELLDPQYHQSEVNSSLIGMDIPHDLSIGHQFQHLVTRENGWEIGVQKLTALYANSRFYEHWGDAKEALLNGEIAITLTVFTGRLHEMLPLSLTYSHLENQVVVVPDVVGIDSSTQHNDESEVFVRYLLSPECQGIILQEGGTRMPVRREAFDMNPGAVDERIYAEYNWTAKSVGAGVEDLLTSGDYALWLYMNSTTFSTRSNLTNCWENIYKAYENASIDYEQFIDFRDSLGESLTVIDPWSLDNETFGEDYAFYLYLYFPLGGEYEWELCRRWEVAANSRFETILIALSEVI